MLFRHDDLFSAEKARFLRAYSLGYLMVANSPCYIEALREQSTDYEHRVRPYTPSYASCQRGKERSPSSRAQPSEGALISLSTPLLRVRGKASFLFFSSRGVIQLSCKLAGAPGLYGISQSIARWKLTPFLNHPAHSAPLHDAGNRDHETSQLGSAHCAGSFSRGLSLGFQMQADKAASGRESWKHLAVTVTNKNLDFLPRRSG